VSFLKKAVTWLTGAKEGEQSRVLLTFVALLCLLISYYLIKPLRNSKFLSEFHPSRLPFVYAGVATLSFLVTKVFSHMAKKIEKYRLVAGAYATIIVFKLLLGFWMSFGGKAAVVCFYFFASVYFLLAVATLWACINDMFTIEQGERCFGFVALGSTIGSIVGSDISQRISKSVLRDYTLYFSIIFLATALALVLLAAKTTKSRPPHRAVIQPEKKEPSRGDFWSELRALAERPYIRRIAMTVLFLGVCTTAIEFVSQGTIDRELARQQYSKTFSQIEGAEFQRVYELKTKSEEERQEYLSELGRVSGLGIDKVQESFDKYRKDLEAETRAFFSETYKFQGLAGVFSLLVVARFLFPRVGMRYCFILLPCLSLIGLCLFGVTVDLFIVQVVIVLVGALNYSLNNAAKEILYTATDEETLFRFKPMIEGPCMRAGDVVSSILKLSVGAVAASFALSELSSIHLFLVVTMIVLIAWIRAAWLAGKEYDFQRKQMLGSDDEKDL
jgi:ATP/ADP translocase